VVAVAAARVPWSVTADWSSALAITPNNDMNAVEGKSQWCGGVGAFDPRVFERRRLVQQPPSACMWRGACALPLEL